jgi:superfamily II DNA or RNA helicase
VVPTGTGKTVVIAHLPPALHGLVPGKKMLVIAHRTELIEQTVAEIKVYNPQLNVGIEQGMSRQITTVMSSWPASTR